MRLIFGIQITFIIIENLAFKNLFNIFLLTLFAWILNNGNIF